MGKIWKRAAQIAGVEALIVLVVWLVLATLRSDTGSYRLFINAIVRVYGYLHTPLFPYVGGRLIRYFLQDPDTWERAKLVVPAVLHSVAFLNTFLVSAAAMSFSHYRRQKTGPRLNPRERYTLQAWIEGRGGFPSPEAGVEPGRRVQMETDLRNLQQALDRASIDTETLILLRLCCLQHLLSYPEEKPLLLALSEATLEIADRRSLDPSKEARRLGWGLLDRARTLGCQEPRLWLAVLRWDAEDPALAAEAEGQLRALASRHPYYLLHLASRNRQSSPEAQLELLEKHLPHMPASLALRAEILALLGRSDEAAKLREKALRMDPQHGQVWRSLLRSIPEANGVERQKAIERAKSLGIDRDLEVSEWLYSEPEPNVPLPMTWLAGGLILLGLFVFLRAPLSLAWRNHLIRRQAAGTWKLAALIRIDEARMPWVEPMPPWITCYDQTEARDYLDLTAMKGRPGLVLNNDGKGTFEFERSGSLTWTVDRGSMVLRSDAGWSAWARPEKDGFALQAQGRRMRMLLQREGDRPKPLLFTDWYVAPQLVSTSHGLWMFDRTGRPSLIMNQAGIAYPAFTASNANGGLAPGAPYYVTPDGLTLQSDYEPQNYTLLPKGKPPSTSLLFP